MNFIDLFAGAGGLSEGFVNAGYTPLAHVEMDTNACNTIKTRLAYHFLTKVRNENIYNLYLKKEITRENLWNKIPREILDSVINREISEDSINDIFNKIDEIRDLKKIDIIIGGPPCQAYSLVGRSRDPNKMEGDKRNYLFRYYAEFLKRYKPEYFLFENVLGLLSAGSKKYLIEMVQLFKSIGYSVVFPTIVNAEDYGVLQKRRRVIIIGHRGNNKLTFPMIDISDNPWQVKTDLFMIYRN